MRHESPRGPPRRGRAAGSSAGRRDDDTVVTSAIRSSRGAATGICVDARLAVRAHGASARASWPADCEAMLAVARRRAADHLGELGRARRRARPTTRSTTSLSARIFVRVAGERAPAGQHLVEHDADRVDIGGRRRRLAARLLRRHVRRRARQLRRSPTPTAATPKSATTTRPSRASSTLSGLMSRWMTSARVRRGEAVAHRASRSRPRRRRGSLRSRRKPRGQRLALDELHRAEHHAVGVAELERARDVRGA